MAEPNYENKTMLMMQHQLDDVHLSQAHHHRQQHPAVYGLQQQQPHPMMVESNLYANHQQQQQQYPIYFPKPYSSVQNGVKPVPIVASNQNARGGVSNVPISVPQQLPAALPTSTKLGYNQNHWLLQEAELRRHLDSIDPSSARMKNIGQQQQQQQQPLTTNIAANAPSKQMPTNVPGPVVGPGGSGGYLSVSGKKKCSSCGDELGKGCAAMVVESLSLYYHINCFRCSVCNVQLGRLLWFKSWNFNSSSLFFQAMEQWAPMFVYAITSCTVKTVIPMMKVKFCLLPSFPFLIPNFVCSFYSRTQV